jgi:hypothetical protein
MANMGHWRLLSYICQAQQMWATCRLFHLKDGTTGRVHVTVLSDYDVGKMNLQLKANEENQDRAQCGKNEAGGMISSVYRARKHVGNGAAHDRSDDAEHDRPEDRYVHVHHRFRDNPRD